MLKWFVDLLANIFHRKDAEPKPAPILRREVSGQEIFNALAAKFPEAQIFLSDNRKWACDIQDIEDFLTLDNTNHEKWREDRFDCDDFAFRLMGQLSVPGYAELTKALVWTDVHALNGFLDTNLDFWFIEPQGDTISDKLEKWQGSKVRLIVI